MKTRTAKRIKGALDRSDIDTKNVVRALANNYVANTGTGINPLSAAEYLGERHDGFRSKLSFLLLLLFGEVVMHSERQQGMALGYAIIVTGVFLVMAFALFHLIDMGRASVTIKEARGSLMGFDDSLRTLEFYRLARTQKRWSSLPDLSLVAEAILVHQAWLVLDLEENPDIGSHHELTLDARRKLKGLLASIKQVASPKHQKVSFDTYYLAARTFGKKEPPNVTVDMSVQLVPLGTPELFGK